MSFSQLFYANPGREQGSAITDWTKYISTKFCVQPLARRSLTENHIKSIVEETHYMRHEGAVLPEFSRPRVAHTVELQYKKTFVRSDRTEERKN